MNRIVKMALVALVTGLTVGHGSLPVATAAVQAQPYTGPIRVQTRAFTKPYVAAVRACMDTGKDQVACQKIIKDTGARCLRVEDWYADNTVRVLRDEC